MAAAFEIEIRTALNPGSPIRLSDEDLFSDSASTGPSALVTLLRPEVKISSPFFGTKTIAPAGPPSFLDLAVRLGALALAIALVVRLARSVR